MTMQYQDQFLEARIPVPEGYIAIDYRPPRAGEEYLWHGDVCVSKVDHAEHSHKVIVVKDEACLTK